MEYRRLYTLQSKANQVWSEHDKNLPQAGGNLFTEFQTQNHKFPWMIQEQIQETPSITSAYSKNCITYLLYAI